MSVNNLNWLNGFRLYPVWFRMSKQELRNKYRRATLGPFWVTLTMALTIYALGALFAPMLGTSDNAYLPNLAVGWVVWFFISGVVLESTELYAHNISVIRNIRLPYSFYIYKCISKNLMLFLHNFIILLIVLILYGVDSLSGLFVSILNFVLLVVNLAITSSIVSIACCRFRDLISLIAAGIQFLFFVSPILWSTNNVAGRRAFYLLNPYYYAIEGIRQPLFHSEVPYAYSFIFLAYTLVLAVIATAIYKRSQQNISLWV